jgi:hypothetical protein
MAQNYNLGDVNISALQLFSERGSINLITSFVSASIYESIFTPGIVCDIKILDGTDLLGQLRLVGDETIFFEISVLGSETASYTLALHELSELESVGAQKGKMYTLKCVSEEAMHAQTNIIQKSYNTLCSEMIQDIHRTYLKSNKPLELEQTSTPQRILVPSKSPFEAINLIRRRSVSAEYRSSLYLFFENRKNERLTHNFVSIENLFDQSTVKDFQMSDAANITILRRGDDNIIAFRIPRQFNSIERIAMGGPRRIETFNFTTWDFETNIVEANEERYNIPGRGTLNSGTFKNRYFSDSPPYSFIPVDISQRPETNIPEATPDIQGIISVLSQNSVRIKVIGDTVLTAGATINCELPNRNTFTDITQDDPLITGKFLISRIHHRIGEIADQPRYTCTVEAIKGRYEESV